MAQRDRWIPNYTGRKPADACEYGVLLEGQELDVLFQMMLEI